MGLNGDIGLRLPDVEWSVRSNAGALEGVEWVDSRLDPELPPMRVVGHDGDARFRGYAYLTTLPTYLGEDTLAAQSRGRPTAWEAQAMLFAQAGWTVASRAHLWAPYSPYPGVLAKMVEAFGVERAVHRYDRERLSRLAAMLPSWYPSRGRLDAANEVLAACGLADGADVVYGRGNVPADSVREEVLCCHSAEWWRARKAEGAQPAYRISGGFLRFQPAEGDGFPLRREDVLVVIGEQGKISLALHRLLPAWTSVRITTSEGGEPAVIAAPPAAQTPPAPTPDAPNVAPDVPNVAPDAPSAAPEPEAPKKRGGKGAHAAPTVVPAEELEDDHTQDALVPEELEDIEEIVVGDADELLDLEEIDLLEVEPEEDPATEPGIATETPGSPREKGPKSPKKTEK